MNYSSEHDLKPIKALVFTLVFLFSSIAALMYLALTETV